MLRIWLDTDIGDDIDDAVALLCAGRHADLRLVGVSSVFGRTQVRAWLAREMLDRLGLPEVPVLPGAMLPLGGGEVHQNTGSYNTLAPALPQQSPRDDGARVAAIAQAMLAVPPFHLVTIGATTNAARLLAEHPQVTRQWQSVTCMAGRLEDDPEWNVRCDPGAAKLVVERLRPRLVGLEASSYTLPRPEVEALFDPSDAASAFLLQCYQRYRHQEDSPLTLFDPITVLSLAHPAAFDLQRLRVMVEPNGRLRLTDDGGEVEYALSADWAALKPVVERVLRVT